MMPPPPGKTYGYPLGFKMVMNHYYIVFSIAIISSVIGGVIPAIKATRIKIIEAIKYV